MEPICAMHTVAPRFKPHPSDSPEIVKLKTQAFSNDITNGPSCIKDLIINMIRDANEVKRRTLKIRKAYEKIKLSPSEQAVFDKIRHCFYCGVEFEQNGQGKGSNRVRERVPINYML